MLLGFITKGILAIVWWRVRPFIEHKSWQKVFFYNVHTRQSGVNFKHLKFNFFRGDESFLLDLSLKFFNRRPSLCHFSPLKDGPMPMRLSSSEILVDSPSLNFFQINKKVWTVINYCCRHYEASFYGLVMKNYFHFSKNHKLVWLLDKILKIENEHRRGMGWGYSIITFTTSGHWKIINPHHGSGESFRGAVGMWL